MGGQRRAEAGSVCLSAGIKGVHRHAWLSFLGLHCILQVCWAESFQVMLLSLSHLHRCAVTGYRRVPPHLAFYMCSGDPSPGCQAAWHVLFHTEPSRQPLTWMVLTASSCVAQASFELAIPLPLPLKCQDYATVPGTV